MRNFANKLSKPQTHTCNIMLFYTAKKHQAILDELIKEKNEEIENILSSYREQIISEIREIVEADDYSKKHRLSIWEKGYIDKVYNCISSENFLKIVQNYNLVFDFYFYSEVKKCPHLLDMIVLDNGHLICMTYCLCTLPFDYYGIPIEDVSSKTLYYALQILKESIQQSQ